ncbi:MAG TPA: cytochrome c oxidase subunit II [Gammaproteobacteria bacterium]|nr:cytochrome c oxidase subunit II [Gammaproteobacteria bacterium]
MAESVTEVGKEMYDLHMLIFWICTVVGIGVFGIIIYSILNHRKSKGATPASFHESTTVEVIWTIIPFAILVAIAIPATKTLLAIEDNTNPELTIQATGHQWYWEYSYIDDTVAGGTGIQFLSNLAKPSKDASELGSGADPREVENYLLEVDNEVVVPVGRKVRLLTTAENVIHSWWVRDLAVKRDAIPGFINESHFVATQEGVYRGQCAELCGARHGFMPIVVRVVSEAAYAQWVSERKAGAAAAAAAAEAAAARDFTLDELMAKGKEVYAANCSFCHQPDGKGQGPFPALAGSKIATGDVAAHMDIVLNGKPNTAMSAFARLSDLELAAVITYERNAWGNDTGDVIQPKQIKAAR